MKVLPPSNTASIHFGENENGKIRLLTVEKITLLTL